MADVLKAMTICAGCEKPISGRLVTALDKTWHSEHFVCAKCEKELGSEIFIEKDGQAYCEKDYQQLFFPRCAGCDEIITGRFINAVGKKWHPDHFVCSYCGKTFGEDGFQEIDGKAYCNDDYLKFFETRCGGCSDVIEGDFVTVLSKQWHPKCLVCTKCKKPFDGTSNFYDFDGKAYCELHYHAESGMLCGACSLPIKGSCVNAKQSKFHQDCFICCYCRKLLNKGTFQEQDSKIYCQNCFIKLFN